jgi:integrase
MRERGRSRAKWKREYGAVDRLPSGNFRARWRQNGKRVTAPMTFATEDDAKNFLVTVQADLLRGKPSLTNTGSMALSEWLDEWLKQPGKSRNAQARDLQGVRAFPRLLPLRLAEIERSDVQNAVTQRSNFVAAATVRRDYSALRACLNAAADNGLIAAAPVPRRIALPKARDTTPPELTDEDLDALVEQMAPRYRALVRTAAVLGFRWSEVIGLRLCDVDFLRKEVTIGQTVEEAKGHLTLVPWGKTSSALRSRPAPGFLLDELSNHIAEFRADEGREALLFVGERCGVLRRSAFVRRHFAPAREAIGFGDLDFHHLRHHGITWLVEAGVPLNELQEWFGHKAVAMTMRYVHATSRSRKEAAKRMEKRWSKKKARRSPEREAR